MCYNIPMEKRIIAFDIGDKRIGVAISDPFNEYAMPGETYFRVGNFKKDVENLLEIAREKNVQKIVCGLPVNYDGSESIQSDKTLKMIEALKENSPVPVVTEDERFTTLQARQVQVQSGVKLADRKKTIDSIAASYILDGYLEKYKKEKQLEAEKLRRHEILKEIRTMKQEYTEDTEEEQIFEVEDDEGNTVRLYHIATIEYKEKWYCVFQQAEPETEEEEDEVTIFELQENGEDRNLLPIEDEALLDEVFAEFCREYENYENSDEAMSLDGAEDED